MSHFARTTIQSRGNSDPDMPMLWRKRVLDVPAALHREEDVVSVARLTLYSHHLATLDRFIAQARRRTTRSGGEFTGVEVEINVAGEVSVHAPNMEPLVLDVATISRYLAPSLAAPLGQE